MVDDQHQWIVQAPHGSTSTAVYVHLWLRPRAVIDMDDGVTTFRDIFENVGSF